MALNGMEKNEKAVDTLKKNVHFGIVSSLPQIEPEMKIQHYAICYLLTYCYVNEELLQRKHLYFYCYCHMPLVSKYSFHYTTVYWSFKMCLKKKLSWKYIITMLNNFSFSRNDAFCVIYCNHFAFNMNWTDILLQMNFLVTNFEIDRLKLIWGCQNIV